MDLEHTDLEDVFVKIMNDPDAASSAVGALGGGAR
jgi:hypothetical protein